MFHKIFNQPTTFLSLPKYLERILMPDASTTRYTTIMSRSDNLCNSDALHLELMNLNIH